MYFKTFFNVENFLFILAYGGKYIFKRYGWYLFADRVLLVHKFSNLPM